MHQDPAQPPAWNQRFDQLPPSPASSRGTEPGPALSETESSDVSSNDLSERRAEKAPHDASVFVGSLPSNIDPLDLTRMLTEHLSEHTQVKSIKVIRDSKGGVCAFVQCEDAQAACALIQTLRSVTPKPFLGRILRFEPARAFRTLHISYRAPTYILPGYATPQVHDLADLPTAMRIWKPQGSKFHHIAYNAEAVAVEALHNGQDNSTRGTCIYLQPLAFDEESLQKMTAYFGRLEKLEPYQVEEEKHDVASQPIDGLKGYSSPHVGPRLPCMDPRCWEVKWNYRDDCVAALMALRRVPHLTVTWAHQPHSLGNEFYQLPRVSYVCHPNQTLRLYQQPSPFLASLPYPSSSAIVSQVGSSDSNGGFPNGCKTTFVVGSPSHDQVCIPPMDMGLALARQSDPPSPFKPITYSTDMPPSDSRIAHDWPPCGYNPDNSQANGMGTTSGQHAPLLPGPVQKLDAAVHPRATHPETPKSRNTMYPITPTSWTAEDTGPPPFVPREVTTQRDIDPMSIFVGGLDVLGASPWTEARVKSHFSKYGCLESVKFVRPYDATMAFAFIKFSDIEGPARAVLEEHNRVYDGRVLRVQLRDCNPPRNPWKNGRGRGRNFLQNQRCLSHGRPHHVPQYEFQVHQPVGPTVDSQPEDQSASHGRTVPVEEDSPFVSEASPTSDDRTLHDATPSPSLVASEDSALKDSATAAGQDPPEKYREWYDDLEPSPSSGSRPSSTPSSTSMNAIPPPAYPYVYQNAPYYATSPAWIPNHMYQAPYPIPYYPGYPTQTLGNSGDSADVGAVPWPASGVMYPAPFYYPSCPQAPGGEPSSIVRPSSGVDAPVHETRSGHAPPENGGQGCIGPPAAINVQNLPLGPQGPSWAPYGHPYFHQPPSLVAPGYQSSADWRPPAMTPSGHALHPHAPGGRQAQPPGYFVNQVAHGPRENPNHNHHHPPVLNNNNHKRQGGRRDQFNHPQRNNYYHHHRPFNGKNFRHGPGGGGHNGEHGAGFVPQRPGAFVPKGKHQLMNRT